MRIHGVFFVTLFFVRFNYASNSNTIFDFVFTQQSLSFLNEVSVERVFLLHAKWT